MPKLSRRDFRRELSTIGDGKTAEGPADQRGVSADLLAANSTQKTLAVSKKRSRSGAVRVLGKTVRLRNKEHRKFVTRQPCLVCGRVPSDSHHLTFTQSRALGRRVSDEFSVPVCRIHHRELHRSGDEAAWWQKLNIDPLPVASRSGSGSTRGSMAVNPPQAEAARRRRLRRSWTCHQFKIELVRTTMRAPMWRAPCPRTSPHVRADDLVSTESRLIE